MAVYNNIMFNFIVSDFPSNLSFLYRLNLLLPYSVFSGTEEE